MRRLIHPFALTVASAAALGADSAPVTRRPNIPSGKIEAHTVFDSTYRRPRRIWVYTPPGYDSRATTPYPLIVAFDGAEYQDTMPLPMILDTLLAAKKTPAFVAVLIDNDEGPTRIADPGNAHKMPDFLAKQLLPWVRKGWKVTTDPQHVIVTGSSAGGLGAAYVALTHPELFGNVWSQSGAFWRGAEASNGQPYEWLTSQVQAWPKSRTVPARRRRPGGPCNVRRLRPELPRREPPIPRCPAARDTTSRTPKYRREPRPAMVEDAACRWHRADQRGLAIQDLADPQTSNTNAAHCRQPRERPRRVGERRAEHLSEPRTAARRGRPHAFPAPTRCSFGCARGRCEYRLAAHIGNGSQSRIYKTTGCRHQLDAAVHQSRFRRVLRLHGLLGRPARHRHR